MAAHRRGEKRQPRLSARQVFIRRLVRPVFVKIADREAVPVVAKLPPRLQDGLTAAPGLIAHLLVSKYCDNLPFYRQEKILATRHGVDIGRNTMCRWTELATFRLRPLYQRIHDGLLRGGYLQADETPIRYLAPGTGKTGQGYLWTLHRPGGDVLFQWHASRGSACLEDLLGGFRGILQCDGYAAVVSRNSNAAEATALEDFVDWILLVSGFATAVTLPAFCDGNRDSHDGCAGRLDQPAAAGSHRVSPRGGSCAQGVAWEETPEILR
jgi:transposase